MDLHSRSHRICLIHPDFCVFAAGSSHTPYWGIDSLIQNVTKCLLYFLLRIDVLAPPPIWVHPYETKVLHSQQRVRYTTHIAKPLRDKLREHK